MDRRPASAQVLLHVQSNRSTGVSAIAIDLGGVRLIDPARPDRGRSVRFLVQLGVVSGVVIVAVVVTGNWLSTIHPFGSAYAPVAPPVRTAVAHVVLSGGSPEGAARFMVRTTDASTGANLAIQVGASIPELTSPGSSQGNVSGGTTSPLVDPAIQVGALDSTGQPISCVAPCELPLPPVRCTTGCTGEYTITLVLRGDPAGGPVGVDITMAAGVAIDAKLPAGLTVETMSTAAASAAPSGAGQP